VPFERGKGNPSVDLCLLLVLRPRQIWAEVGVRCGQSYDIARVEQESGSQRRTLDQSQSDSPSFVVFYLLPAPAFCHGSRLPRSLLQA